jgi:hypothetical protein
MFPRGVAVRGRVRDLHPFCYWTHAPLFVNYQYMQNLYIAYDTV